MLVGFDSFSFGSSIIDIRSRLIERSDEVSGRCVVSWDRTIERLQRKHEGNQDSNYKGKGRAYFIKKLRLSLDNWSSGLDGIIR